MKTYNIWNDLDPNDNFDIVAENEKEALFLALQELGWIMGKGETIEE